MKKFFILIVFILLITNYQLPITAYAVSPTPDVFGKISPPAPLTNIGIGAEGLNNILNKAVQLIYVAAAVIFVFMVLFSALQWIMSGGDKEKVSQARGRLTHAIIGITILAFAFVIIKLVGQITGFEFFAGQNTNPPSQINCQDQPDPLECFDRLSDRP